LQRASRENVKLIELSVFPDLPVRKIRQYSGDDLDLEEGIVTMSRAMKKGESAFDIVSGIIVNFNERTIQNDEFFRKIVECKRVLERDPDHCTSIVGADIGDFDMEYLDNDPNTERLLRVRVETLKKEGFGIRCHAGEATIIRETGGLRAIPRETGLAENIKRAVNLGVDRIGHGLGAVKSREVLDLLKNEKVHVELCPVSNFKTNVFKDYEAEYPLLTFLDRGISCSLNSDDPTISGSSWTDDYQMVIDTFNLPLNTLRILSKTAFERSFVPAKAKSKMARHF
jgi:adenosine deaminase